MTNRKKRLKKGIESIKEQIILHEEKKDEAEKQGNVELVNYYRKEIAILENEKEKKEEILK